MHERIQRVRDHQDRCEHRLAYHRLFGPTDNRKRQTNNAQTIDATPRGQTIICPSKLSYDRHAREAEEFETSPRAAPIMSEGPTFRDQRLNVIAFFSSLPSEGRSRRTHRHQ